MGLEGECVDYLNGVRVYNVCWSRNDPLAYWRGGKDITNHYNRITGRKGNNYNKVGCTAHKCHCQDAWSGKRPAYADRIYIWCYLAGGDLGSDWDKYDRRN